MSTENDLAEWDAINKKLGDAIKAIKANHDYTNEEVVALLRFHADFLEKRFVKNS